MKKQVFIEGEIMYDVIIAGASFAGLSVSMELEGDVLLIDKNEIGTFETSACATPYDLLEEIECEKSVLRICDTFAFHAPKNYVEIHPKYPYCTFDYRRFCKIIAKRIDGEIVKDTVISVDKSKVITQSSKFYGKCIVDCTGWKTVLARSLRNDYVNRKMMVLGVESVADFKDDKFSFFYDFNILKKGVTWIFPIGKKSRIGIASYAWEKNLGRNLERFLQRFGVRTGEIHGGYIPYGLREPIVSNIFMVGDSAGQALPFTAEGIRKSIHFGRECGRIIQKIIDNKITLKEGLRRYEKFVLKRKKYYDFLLKVQNRLISNPDVGFEFFLKLLENKKFVEYLESRYRRI